MRSVWLHFPVLLLLASASAAASDCPDCADTPALAIDGIYTGEIWRNTAGGIATGNRYLDNVDLTIAADGAKLLGLPGLQFFGYLLYDNGHSIAELSNSAQGISNIEASRAVRLYELWTQWQFGAQDSSVRFGLYDLNSEFDCIDTAGLFINPSHGIGPDFSQSGDNGPSIFPDTSLAVRGLTTAGRWTFQAAVLDGVPGDPDHPDRSGIHLSSEEGALLVGEINYRSESGARIGTGYWRYTAEFDDLAAVDDAGMPQQRTGNAGMYLIAESPTLFAADAERGLKLFARTGNADDRINPVRRYYGSGGVYTGWSARRPEDQIGFAIAVAELGRPFRNTTALSGTSTTQREYDYELTYRFGVTDWLTLQSDIQYVRNPGMDPTLDAAWVVGLRFEIAHSWSW